MNLDTYKLLLQAIDELKGDEAGKERLRGIVEGAGKNGFQQGDMDKNGEYILLTVNTTDLVGAGVLPEDYVPRLRRRHLEEIGIAVANVDPENHRDHVASDLAECFVSQVHDPREPELWVDMPRTATFCNWAAQVIDVEMPDNIIGEMFVVTTDRFPRTAPRGSYVEGLAWDADRHILQASAPNTEVPDHVWTMELRAGEFVWSRDAEVNGGADE